MKRLNVTCLLLLVCSFALISLASGFNEVKAKNLRGKKLKNKVSKKDANINERLLRVSYASNICEVILKLCMAKQLVIHFFSNQTLRGKGKGKKSSKAPSSKRGKGKKSSKEPSSKGKGKKGKKSRRLAPQYVYVPTTSTAHYTSQLIARQCGKDFSSSEEITGQPREKAPAVVVQLAFWRESYSRSVLLLLWPPPSQQ